MLAVLNARARARVGAGAGVGVGVGVETQVLVVEEVLEAQEVTPGQGTPGFSATCLLERSLEGLRRLPWLPWSE
jgi:hypothetical protein